MRNSARQGDDIISQDRLHCTLVSAQCVLCAQSHWFSALLNSLGVRMGAMWRTPLHSTPLQSTPVQSKL